MSEAVVTDAALWPRPNSEEHTVVTVRESDTPSLVYINTYCTFSNSRYRHEAMNPGYVRSSCMYLDQSAISAAARL